MTTKTCTKCRSTCDASVGFCPDCGERFDPSTLPAGGAGPAKAVEKPLQAKRVRHNHNNGGGCLVALLGLCVIWVFPVGTIAGVLLIAVGSAISYKFVCSHCGNPLEKTSKRCPACQAEIAQPGFFG